MLEKLISINGDDYTTGEFVIQEKKSSQLPVLGWDCIQGLQVLVYDVNEHSFLYQCFCEDFIAHTILKESNFGLKEFFGTNSKFLCLDDRFVND